jgi:hypothetical protein
MLAPVAGLWSEQPLAGLSALPVASFEFSLGVWLVVKGFNPEAVAALERKTQSRDSDLSHTGHSSRRRRAPLITVPTRAPKRGSGVIVERNSFALDVL